ncbi:MAG: type II toxin-antitoxin system HicB family antitoxin [Dehalococcoidia bacterium]
MRKQEYTVVFEKTRENYSAYLPDLPGCVAAGDTREEVERNIREAVAFHLDGMRREGLPIPRPTAWTELVEAAV